MTILISFTVAGFRPLLLRYLYIPEPSIVALSGKPRKNDHFMEFRSVFLMKRALLNVFDEASMFPRC